MSLPWFPFYADAYTGDTGHLTCEEHGAYLQLMLGYYRSEKPLPGTDRALAALVKLPMDRWLECKPAIAPFFRDEGGLWHHDRIDEEMKDRHAKHAQSKAKAQKAAAASHAKQGHKPATSSAPSQQDVEPVASSSATHLHLHLSKTLSTESARDAIEEEGCAEGASVHPETGAEDPDLGIGTPIDRLFQLNANQLATCKFDGATPEIIEAERVTFISRHLEKGTFSNDWDASWTVWWQRWKEYVAKQAEAAERAAQRIAKREATLPARVEVNNVIDWDKHCAFWVKVGRWSRDLGPDPDSTACRCPLEILIKHKLRKETVS